MSYIMLTSAAFLLAMDFALNKLYQKLRGTSPKVSLFFNSVLGLATAVIFFVMNKCRFSFSSYSALMAMIMSVLVMSYNIIGFRLLKIGSMAIYTLFLMTGGMVLPYIFGLMFLGEPFSILKTSGLVFIITAIVMSNFSSGKINGRQILMCIAVFTLNGFVSIISKLHQIEVNYECVSSVEFVILGGICKFVIAGILYLIFSSREKQSGKTEHPGMALLIIISSAAVGGLSSVMQLNGAKALPATLLYPFITGGSIVFSALTGVVAFKERLSAKTVISIVLCFAGTIMFL